MKLEDKIDPVMNWLVPRPALFALAIITALFTGLGSVVAIIAICNYIFGVYSVFAVLFIFLYGLVYAMIKSESGRR